MSKPHSIDVELLERLVVAIEKLIAGVSRIDRSCPIDTAEVCRRYRLAPDTLRRIPISKLPKFKPGRVVLYFPDDLDRYLRLHCVVGQSQFEPLTDINDIDIDELADRVHGRVRKRRTKI
jgi:hypothetical protein